MLMTKPIDRYILLLLLAVFPALLMSAQAGNAAISSTPSASIVQLTIQGAIGPATSDYIERSMDKAVESGAKAILIAMDTPGGLDVSMHRIIKKIIASPIPVISYVTPGGARAASAGTYIMYAGHIAAMTPGRFQPACPDDAVFGMGADAVYAGRLGRESGLTLTAANPLNFVSCKTFSILRI